MSHGQAMLASCQVRRSRSKRPTDSSHLASPAANLQSALLASLSHDLRTPLVSVIGSLSALRKMEGMLSCADQRQLIASALGEAERLNRLIANLLDATRLSLGGLPLHLAPVAVETALAAAIARLSALTAGRIETRLPLDLPPVRADSTLLEQVLINVLENAAKYSASGGQIRVTARHHEDGVIIAVEDQGPGIAPEDRSRIFDFLFRARGRRSVPGNGLGLAICRGFVHAMQGTIAACAGREGSGTSVEIKLPCPNG